jgi:protein TonB
MTAWAEQLHRSQGAWRQGTLWTGAALVMAFAHAGGVAWMLRQPPVEMADNAPPPAIMIEMAVEPEAINTEEKQIAEEMQESAEVKSDTVEPIEKPEEMVEQPTPEEIQPEQPVEEMTQAEPSEKIEPEPEVDPIEQTIISQLENVEVPIPVFRPEPEKERPIEKPTPRKKEIAKKPERKKPAPSSKAANEAATQVRQSNRNAASQTTAGMGFGSVSPAKWQSRLMAHLERRKKYPSAARSRGERGTVYVRFRIDDGGNVLSASLARSSGFPELDAEVLSLVRRASPVPAPPAGVSRTITAPVRFTVR